MKKATVVVEFKIEPDGSIALERKSSSSGDVQLDEGVLSALKAASPLSAMPEKWRGKELSVRGSFTYNPDQLSKLIKAGDIPTLFLQHEFRIGVKLEDKIQWSNAAAYVEAF